MTLDLKRGLAVACVALAALSVPTPAMAADYVGSSAGASGVEAAGICDIAPQFWWCTK